MRRAKLNFEKHLDQFRKLVTVAFLLTTGILANRGVAQEKGQKTFSTPEAPGRRSTPRPRTRMKRFSLKSSGRAENRSSTPEMKSKMRRVAPHS